MTVTDLTDEDDLVLMTEAGKVVRIAGSTISVIGRATQGVTLIGLREGARLISVARVVPEKPEEMEEGAETPEDEPGEAEAGESGEADGPGEAAEPGEATEPTDGAE